MNEILIGPRVVGAADPVLVVAEIGVNHDGSVRRALELVEHAARAGADAVKLQIFRAEALMHESAAFAGYQKDRCGGADPAGMLRRYELSLEDLREVCGAIRNSGMLPIATPFSVSDVDLIESLELPAIKIASPDLVNKVLLKRCAAVGRPLLVSTGAATMQEVQATAQWLGEQGATFALLHCISSYPTPPEQAQLAWIGDLARFGVPVGYSDHTTEPLSGALAVAAGACIVEKHLTYDREAAGPDHATSADAWIFECYVQMIRTAERMRGLGGKRVLAVEADVRRVSRQSLVLRRDLALGERLTESDITTQRPGTGISAAELESAVGRRIRQPLKAGTLLQWDMLEVISVVTRSSGASRDGQSAPVRIDSARSGESCHERAA